MKAQIGDYIRTGDGILKVVALDGADGEPGSGYVLENGSLLTDSEISNNDVLLESEAFDAIEQQGAGGALFQMDCGTVLQTIWDDVLVGICGVRADGVNAAAFVMHHATPSDSQTEWRFGGSLGFGGKFRTRGNRCWVDCYPEDETPGRLLTIQRANHALRRLRLPVRDMA